MHCMVTSLVVFIECWLLTYIQSNENRAMACITVVWVKMRHNSDHANLVVVHH